MSLNGSEDWQKVEVWDKDRWSPDDLMATSGRVLIGKVINDWVQGKAVWINLKSSKAEPTKLRITVRLIK